MNAEGAGSALSVADVTAGSPTTHTADSDRIVPMFLSGNIQLGPVR